MKKRFGSWDLGIGICLGFGILMLGFTTLVVGCAQTTETATTTTTTCASTTTTTTAASTTTTTTSTTSTSIPSGLKISISGSLKTGTMSIASAKASGMKSQAISFGAVPDYNVVAVSKDTGKIYFASSETDSSGNFTIPNLPAAESFYLEVLDSGNKLVAPVTLGSEGGRPVMAVAPGASNLNLGDINYDSSKGGAAPTTEPTSQLDLATSVEVKSGETLVPKGAGNLGKGSITQISSGSYLSDKIDGDKDGLPNFFDADNNGDLVPDEFDGFYSKEAFATSGSKISHSFLFTNMKVTYGYSNTYQDDYSEFSPAIGIFPKSGYTISSAYLSEGPSWVTKAKIVGGDNFWKDTQPIAYSLGGMPDGVFVQHLHNLVPTKEVNAGDVLKFKVEFSDGSSEEVVKMVNFVFSDIPRLVEYHLGPSGSWTSAPAPTGGHQNLSEATTLEVHLRWHRPRDENGNEIIGGRYTWEYWPAVAGQGQEITIISLDSGATATLEGSYNFYGLISDEAAAQQNFNIGICIRNDNNDNAAQNIGFVKNW